jgi:hypothetical protein
VAERPYHRWQRQLKLWFYQLVHREPHDLPLSASTQSRIRLTFTVRNAGLAKEDEYVAVHGRRRVEIDENVELERAPSRGEEAHIISASSCSTIARRNKRILDHLRVSPLNTSVFGIFFPCKCTLTLFTVITDQSAEQDRRRTPTDSDSDMPSSALTTRPSLSTPGTTPALSYLLPLPGVDRR